MRAVRSGAFPARNGRAVMVIAERSAGGVMRKQRTGPYRADRAHRASAAWSRATREAVEA